MLIGQYFKNLNPKFVLEKSINWDIAIVKKAEDVINLAKSLDLI